MDLLRYQAGLCAVEGPGIMVTLNDSKQKVKLGDNQNLYIVHDEDLLRVINELRAAGAEAIAINDQRLVSRSEIRCVGPTVTVNGKMFGPPFRSRRLVILNCWRVRCSCEVVSRKHCDTGGLS